MEALDVVDASQDPSQSNQRVKVWKLRGGDMEVISVRRKRQTDSHSTLELKFTLVGDLRPRIIGENLYIMEFQWN